MSYDLSDPCERLRCVEDLGPAGYNAAMESHFERSAVAKVNGYRIRTVHSRFGILYYIDGAQIAYATLERSMAEAAKLPTR